MLKKWLVSDFIVLADALLSMDKIDLLRLLLLCLWFDPPRHAEFTGRVLQGTSRLMNFWSNFGM
jgi:hypothetical protein